MLKSRESSWGLTRPFLKEFRVVGQICHEGMDESGILPKALYAMTSRSLPGAEGGLGVL